MLRKLENTHIRSVPLPSPEQMMIEIETPDFSGVHPQDVGAQYIAPSSQQYTAPLQQERDRYQVENQLDNQKEIIFEDKDTRLVYDENGQAYLPVTVASHTIHDAEELGLLTQEDYPQFDVDETTMIEPQYDEYPDEYAYDEPGYDTQPVYERQPQIGIQGRMLPLLLGVIFVAVLSIYSVRFLSPDSNIGRSTTSSLEANIAAAANALRGGQRTQQDQPAAAAPNPTSLGRISPVFMPTVQHWEWLIVQVSDERGLDPDMMATIMQIESCGDPAAQSWAGAMGLFQVMPFHFATGEDMLDPYTNATRGANYFAERMVQTSNNPYLSFAGYNGGHGAAGSSWDNWPAETQRYYTWGKGIFDDAKSGTGVSATLQEWLAAGGQGLCNQAATRLGY